MIERKTKCADTCACIIKLFTNVINIVIYEATDCHFLQMSIILSFSKLVSLSHATKHN